MSKTETLIVAVLVLAGAAFLVPYRDVALVQSFITSLCAGLMP